MSWRERRVLVYGHRGGALEAPESTWDAFDHAAAVGCDGLELDVHVVGGEVVVTHDPVAAAPPDVPRLAEVIDRYPDLYVNVDLKEPGAAVPVARVLAAAGRGDDVIVASFHDEVLRAFRASAPDVATSLAPGEATALWAGEPLPPSPGRRVAAQVPVRWGGVEVVTRAFVDRAHALGLAVHVWTVDDTSEVRRLLDIGVDGVVTDRPSVVVPAVRGLSP